MSSIRPSPSAPEARSLPDEALVARIAQGDPALFEELIRRHNQRVYRTVRAFIRDEVEVEDVMQQAYLAAFRALGQFDQRARFTTWLTRIVVNEALQRTRRRAQDESLGRLPRVSERSMSRPIPSPEESAAMNELHTLLESAIDELPESYRAVFMLRELEGLSSADVANALSITEETVRTRLHRAKGKLQETLLTRAADPAEVFAFHAPRCDRVTGNVMREILASSAVS